MSMPIIKRCSKNPLISPNPDLWYGKDEARNPGVVFDGKTFHMVFTASTDKRGSGDIVLGYAKSDDGMNFECAPEPFLSPSSNFDDFDYGTVEDTRITELDGKFYIAYAARSMPGREGIRQSGPDSNLNPTWTQNFRRVGLAVTEDWKQVDRLGPITSEHVSDANVVLFPEKINGKYVFLHRPTTSVPWELTNRYCPGNIWVCFSDELKCCASDKREMPWDMVEGVDIPDDHLLIRPEYDWEGTKVGGSGVPIPTDDGWLMLYHAVDRQGIYRVGLLLLDRDNPCKVIARSPLPIMEPEAKYETDCIRVNGTPGYPSCIFPTANVVVGDEVFIYYGSQDLHSCLATVKLKELLNYILSCRIK